MTLATRASRNRKIQDTTVFENVSEDSVLDCDTAGSKRDLLLDHFDGLNPEHVASAIADIKDEMAKRVEKLNAKMNAIIAAQNECYAMSMIHIPKSIRQKTIKEFNEMYDVDIIKEAKNHNIIDKENALPNGSCTSQNPFQTPARIANMPTGHPSARTLRRGEMLYSKNGSPVERYGVGEIVATCRKAERGMCNAVLTVNLGNGQCVKLGEGGAFDGLDQKAKSHAFKQIQILQEKLKVSLEELREEN